MNARLFYFVLAVQVFFAGSLVVIGTRARENRRAAYMDLTYRASSGQAREADFEALSAHLGPAADAQAVRALFGVPLQIGNQLEMGAEKEGLQQQKGAFWLYYPQSSTGIVDVESLQTLRGPVRSFVVAFDAEGRAKASLAWVNHPLASK